MAGVTTTLPLPSDCKLAVEGEEHVPESLRDSADTQEWLGVFHSWSPAQQRAALWALLASLSVQLLLLVGSWLPALHKRDFVAFLPESVVSRILLFLDMRTLARATQVSRPWRARAESSTLWHQHCLAHWALFCHHTDLESERAADGSGASELLFWKDIFRQRYIVDRGWETARFARRVLHSDPASRRCVRFDQNPIPADSPLLTSSPPVATRINISFDGPAEAPATPASPSGDVPPASAVGSLGKMVSGGFSEVLITDIATGRRLATIDTHHQSWVYALAYDDPNDHLFTGCWDTHCRLFEMSSGACLQEYAGHTGGVWSLEPNYHTHHLYSGSNDNTARVWDMHTATTLATLTGHLEAVRQLQWDPIHNLLYTASADFRLRAWDLRTWECTHVFKGHADVVSCLQVDDTSLFSGSHDGLVKQWDVAMPRAPVANYRGLARTAQVTCLRFDDAKLVAGSSDALVSVWDLRSRSENLVNAADRTYRPAYTLTGHTTQLADLQFDDTLMVSVSRDQAPVMWRVHHADAEPAADAVVVEAKAAPAARPATAAVRRRGRKRRQRRRSFD